MGHRVGMNTYIHKTSAKTNLSFKNPLLLVAFLKNPLLLVAFLLLVAMASKPCFFSYIFINGCGSWHQDTDWLTYPKGRSLHVVGGSRF